MIIVEMPLKYVAFTPLSFLKELPYLTYKNQIADYE